MSNCIFCVKRAGCARQKLVRTLAKGLFVISGSVWKVQGDDLSPNGPLAEKQISVQVSTHLLPGFHVYFLQASVYFVPAGRSKREYMALSGCREQIFLFLVEIEEAGLVPFSREWVAGMELSQSKESLHFTGPTEADQQVAAPCHAPAMRYLCILSQPV